MTRTRRVGAHRSPMSTTVPRWAIALGALVAVVLLTVIGLFLLQLLRPSGAPVPEPTGPAPTLPAESPGDPLEESPAP